MIPNPSGLCMCGCGQPAPISNETKLARFRVKGLPSRFIMGHSSSPFRTDRPKWDVDPNTGCWLWSGALNEFGYGITGSKRWGYLAHRASYARFVGPIPEGLELDHLCRVRRCINPDHLEPVTHRENVWRSASCVLTPDDVIAIRLSADTIPELAERYGVAPVAISQAQSGLSWAGVPMPEGAVKSITPRRRPTHCKHGHEFTPANTRVEAGGKRKCRACCADRERRARAEGRRAS
jgi:hypothetical protein